VRCGACNCGSGRHPGRARGELALGELVWFRRELYASLIALADALFELTDAVLCTDGPVTSLVELSLLAEHRRGHGALYDALAAGRVEPERLRRMVAALPLPTVGWANRARGRCQARGCARTPRPARTGCSATSTAAGRVRRR
jgi:hypothetical protein